jgi:hypothetical protein
MSTLQVTILDGVIVVDDVGRLVPDLELIDPELLGVDWDGVQGVLVYRSHSEMFDNPTVVEPWFQLYEAYAPPPVIYAGETPPPA